MASRRGPDLTCRVALVGSLRGQACANVMYFKLSTSGSIVQADLDTWTAAVAAAFKTRMQGSLPSDYTFSYAKAVLFTPGGGELVSTNTPTAWSGTSGATSLVGSVCVVLSWSSGVYWRGGKPRTYIPASTGAITAGTDQIAGATRTAIATAASNLKNDFNALTATSITGTQFGFVSFRSGNAERTPPVFFAITGVVIHPRVGSQRRRDGKWQN
jgi:hypothetical protein